MGNMYNLVHGVNPVAPLILQALQHPKEAYGRIRDAWIEKDDAGEPVFVVFTRNGGGNRQHYGKDEEPAGPKCDCTGCTMTFKVPKLAGYLRDRDDSFDSTYAYVYFAVPKELTDDPEVLAKLKDLALPHEEMDVRSNRAVEAMRAASAKEGT